MRYPVFTKAMKWVSITLLLLVLFWQPFQNRPVALEILICVGALLVVTEAWRAQKLLWATGFVAIAVLFNPVVPLVLTRKTFFLLELACLGAFLLSLTVLTANPPVPKPGIINRNRRIQSQFQ